MHDDVPTTGNTTVVAHPHRLAPAKNPLAAYPNATYLVATADNPAGTDDAIVRTDAIFRTDATLGVSRTVLWESDVFGFS